MNRRAWTPEELEIVRRDYGRRPAAQIAAEIGRPVHAVYCAADRLGLMVQKPWIRTPYAERLLRQRHAEGWSDAEIAPLIGMGRRSLSDWRRTLGLPHNGLHERFRRRVAAKTMEQCRAAGVENLGALRVLILKERSARAGWPADIPWRAGQILTLLWENGPMTRRQIVEAMRPDLAGKCTRIVMNKALMDNDVMHGKRHPNSYLATLLRRGLIVSLGRIVRMGGQGKNMQLYSIPVGVERGPLMEERTNGE